MGLALQKGLLNWVPNWVTALLFIGPILVFTFILIRRFVFPYSRAVALILFTLAWLVWGGVAWFIAFRPSPSGTLIPEALLNSQIQEIRQLQEFMGGKDESELRELFDFAKMLKYDIRYAKEYIAPGNGLVTEEQASEMNNFFKGGASFYVSKYVEIISLDNAGGRTFRSLKGRAGLLNISPKFVTNKRVLAKFGASAQMPKPVRDAIKRFEKNLDDNLYLISFVINEQAAKDQDNVLYDDDPKSSYFGATFNEYWSVFSPLKPKAEQIEEEIRKYLKVS